MSDFSSRNRWRLLLKTLGHDVQHLSSLDYDSRLITGPGRSEEDPEVILQKCLEMLHDLQDLLKEHKKQNKVKVATVRNETVMAMSKTTVELDTDRPIIPVPPILATLQKIESDLAETNSLLANLKSKNSAKAHRSLLEQQDILTAKRKRVQKELDLMQVASHDLLTVGTAREVHDTMMTIIKSAESSHDFLRYFKNVLIHAIILAIIEATFEEKRQARVSAIVGRILDLSVLAQQQTTDHALDPTDHLNTVFQHAAIARLPLSSLLDKPTLNRFNARDQDSGKSVPSPQDKKGLNDRLIKHWILTQTWVPDSELMVDSYALLPKTAADLAKDVTKSNVSDQQPVKDRDDAANSKLVELVRSPDVLSTQDNDTAEDSGADLTDLADTADNDKDAEHDENYALEFPSVPDSKITPHESQLHDDGDDNEELDAQRLTTLFASSTSSDTSSEHDEPDYSEIVDLTPAEQEEVFKALASAREHHVDTGASEWKDDETVEELMKRAQSALQEFNQEVQKQNDHDPVYPEPDDDNKTDKSK